MEAQNILNKEETMNFVNSKWDNWFVTGLSDFVRIPNLTYDVDPEYLTNGLMEKAMDLVDSYINKLEIKGLTRQIFKTQAGIPLICYVVEPSNP